MKLFFVVGCALVCAASTCSVIEAAPPQPGVSSLDNGTLKIGVDVRLGGAITYLSKSGSAENLVNSADWGRQIQMSHYSGPVPFAPEGKTPKPEWAALGWNPIQAGDAFGNRSQVLAHSNDGTVLYTKCVPMQWPLDNVPGDCTLESWISLSENVVNVRCRLNNARLDKTQYVGRSQELPAVYTNGAWFRLVSYLGDQPFTNAALTDLPVVFPWTGWQATENWTALVDKNGFGLGVVSPDNPTMIGGFAGTPGAGGAKDFPTGYIAPLHQEILDHDIEYEYRYFLVVGFLEEIRQRAATLTPKPAPPNYRFARDRQHWTLANATDSGWPIRGELRVKLESNDPQLHGPDSFWRAENAPKLFIEAAFHSAENSARIFWKRHDAHSFSDERSASFAVVPDGKMRVYEIDLSASSEYRGAITGLRLDPVDAGRIGDWARVKSIGFLKPKP